MSTWLLIPALLLFAPDTPQTPAPATQTTKARKGRSSPPAIIASVVKAHGGAEAVARLSHYRATGTVKAHVRQGDATMSRQFQGPGRLRVALEYGDRTEVRILDGDAGWRGDAATQVPVAGFGHTSMVYQMIRTAAPWYLSRPDATVTIEPPVEVDGVEYLVLRLHWSPALAIDFWIGRDDRRIARVVGTLHMQNHAMQFATYYDDYRSVDGALIPFTEHNIVRGNHVATTRITKIELGADDLGPFAPQAAGAP